MYNPTRTTSKHIASLLSTILDKIAQAHIDRPDLVLLFWPQVIGEKLAPMTQAVSFQEGILLVKVKNSTLYSLLVQHEKRRLLKALKAQFPSVQIRDILFRLG